MTPPAPRKRNCQCPRARHKHGTRGAYLRDRCRCLPCALASQHALAEYRAGRTWREDTIPKVGTARRLAALMAIGYSAREIAEHSGLSVDHVQNLRVGRNPTVLRRTAATVARVYDTLSMTPATGPQAAQQRTKARRLGYLPPLAWDDIDDPNEHPGGYVVDLVKRSRIDEIAVERAIRGDQVRLTPAELTVAARKLLAMGWTVTAAATHLHVGPKKVRRAAA